MAHRGGTHIDTTTAHDPELGGDIADVIGLGTSRVLDLGEVPTGIVGILARLEDVGSDEHAIMDERRLEDRMIPAGGQQFRRSLDCASQPPISIDHDPVGMEPAREVTNLVPSGKRGTYPV